MTEITYNYKSNFYCVHYCRSCWLYQFNLVIHRSNEIYSFRNWISMTILNVFFFKYELFLLVIILDENDWVTILGWTIVITSCMMDLWCVNTNLLPFGQYWIYLLRLMSVANFKDVSDMSIIYNNTLMTELSHLFYFLSFTVIWYFLYKRFARSNNIWSLAIGPKIQNGISSRRDFI